MTHELGNGARAMAPWGFPDSMGLLDTASFHAPSQAFMGQGIEERFMSFEHVATGLPFDAAQGALRKTRVMAKPSSIARSHARVRP